MNSLPEPQSKRRTAAPRGVTGRAHFILLIGVVCNLLVLLDLLIFDRDTD